MDGKVNIGWAKKTRMFLRSYNFATTDDRKACNMSKVSEFNFNFSTAEYNNDKVFRLVAECRKGKVKD